MLAATASRGAETDRLSAVRPWNIEVRTVASGHAMARFALAVDRGVANVQGKRRKATEVIADRVRFLDRKPRDQRGSSQEFAEEVEGSAPV